MTKEKKKDFPKQQQNLPGKESDMIPEPEIIREEYKGSGKLNSKTALITGGDSGIGRAVAVHYAKEGANVAIIYLEEDEDAKTTKELVEEAGGKCLIIKGDIKEREFCFDAVQKVVDTFGDLNILVNNAGEQHVRQGMKELDLDLTEKTFQTNVISMF